MHTTDQKRSVKCVGSPVKKSTGCLDSGNHGSPGTVAIHDHINSSARTRKEQDRSMEKDSMDNSVNSVGSQDRDRLSEI